MTTEKITALVMIGVVSFFIGYTFAYNCGNWPETENLSICHKR